MNLKELLKKDFGTDLPISGGTGNSMENVIVINTTGSNDYSATEYAILQCLGIGRRIEWKLLSQTLLGQNGKFFDQMKIETKQITEDEIITTVEIFYFDITECLAKKQPADDAFDENATLDKIAKRILELETENDFNKECTDVLRNGELNKDYVRQLTFCNVIFEDEIMALFKSIYHHKNLY